MNTAETVAPSVAPFSGCNPVDLKHGYKLAASVIWEANERLARDANQDVRRDSIIARRQAGRVMMAIDADHIHFETTMAKYERSLMDFLYA